jgi:AraC-like DNA-binding protein
MRREGDLGTVSVRTLQPFLAYSRSRGVDLCQLLATSGITLEQVMQGELNVSHRAYVRALEAGAQLADDPDFGLNVAASLQFPLMAALSTVSEYVLAQLLVTSPTVLAGLESVCRGYPVVITDAKLTVERSARGHVLRYLPNDPAVPRVVTDFALGWIMCGLRAVATRDVVPLVARFRHEVPADASAYRALFGSNLVFSADDDAFELSHEAGAIPLGTAKKALHDAAHKRAAQALARAPQPPQAEIVRTLVASELPAGNPSAARIAERLDISVRTLARRLADEGTTHQAIVDSVRAERAEQYLRAGHTVLEVAQLVGFADESAFNRAFRRWHGCSPRAWLKNG